MHYKFVNVKPGTRRDSFIKEIKDTFVYLFPVKKEDTSSVRLQITYPGRPSASENIPQDQLNIFQRLWVVKKNVVVLSMIVLLFTFSTLLFLYLRATLVMVEGNFSYVKLNQEIPTR